MAEEDHVLMDDEEKQLLWKMDGKLDGLLSRFDRHDQVHVRLQNEVKEHGESLAGMKARSTLIALIISLAIGAIGLFIPWWKTWIGGGPKIPIFILAFLLTGCGATGPLGERLLRAKLLSEEKKGALVVCFRANAIVYGGGNTAVVKLTSQFKGRVEVKNQCEIIISTTEGEEEDGDSDR